VNNIKR